MKKSVILLVLAIISVIAVNAQPPQAFKYQAVVRDNSGEILQNQSVGIRISIHDSTSVGTIIYQETFSETTNQFGLVNLEIGTGTPTIGTFTGIDWSSNSKFIETEIDPLGGIAYVSLGTSELQSVPYALYSDRSKHAAWEKAGNEIFYNDGYVGIGTSLPGTNLHIQKSNNEIVRLQSESLNGWMSFYNSNGYIGYWGPYNGENDIDIGTGASNNIGKLHLVTKATPRMTIDETGNVGIGTTTPNAYLHVNDRIRVGEDPTYGNVFGELIHEGGGNGFKINANAGGGWADMHFQTDGNTRMFIESGGSVGIGTTSPGPRLTVKSSGYTGGMNVLADDDDRIFRVRQSSSGAGGVYVYDNADNATIAIAGDGNSYFNSGNVGIGTSSPSSKLDVRGNITIRSATTGSIVMELGTGLDYAEGFNVSNSNTIEPGTILCIDPENPGKLKISENPYDKTVAGIVAGANGLGSGVRLGTQEFDCDVALAGRVYCNTIATNENIEPGDLLTTSSVPGYAMKVTDFENAHGAILGKAMESLEKGKKGQILVLVTLH
ncbi:MAG: hypothetical protein H8D45_27100 [Bacteroidetes bacterium]|nr:hypothetical protein [Bacteroidota bacterium]MBL7102834.1 hypothetical protein [Bacteroidales bacterium]